MARSLTILILLTCASASWAQKKPGKDSSLQLVPLVNMKAPVVAVWFVAAPKIPFEDTAAVEQQIYDDFFKRMDIRMLSREKMLEMLGKIGDHDMQGCNGNDTCLYRIGKALKVDLMVGVVMVGNRSAYKIILKCFDLRGQRPTQLNAVVEGSLTDLLIGGSADAVASVFENRDQYAPVDLNALHQSHSASGMPATAPARKKEKPSRIARRRPKQPPAEEAGLKLPAPEKPGFFKQHLWSAVSAGTSVAFLIGGIVFGASSKSIEGDWGDDQVWDPDRNQRGKDYALAANVLFGLSGAAAVTSLLLYLLAEKRPGSEPTVSVVPAGAGIQASFKF